MRIGVGYLLQETNSFSPVSTKLEDFHLLFGTEVVDHWKEKKAEIGGFLDVLSQARAEIVPLFSGWAITAGPIERNEFGRMRSVVRDQIRKAGQFDALLLALHGAMCAEGTDDCEGLLLHSIRQIAGSKLPIVLTLDLHANVTAQIAAQANAVVGYKTYPHLDAYETGVTAAELLLRTLQGEIQPVTVMQKIPMIVPAENMQTTHGPMAEVFCVGETFCSAHPEIVCISAFGVQPWLDIEEMGCATVVVADGNDSAGAECARQMAERFWNLREAFELQLLDLREAIRIALATDGKPVVLSESSDSPTAGSPGDSAELLRALLEYAPQVPAALWLRDPAAVERSWELMPGSRLRVSVGAAFDKANRQPVPIEGVIRSLSDGRFTLKGGWNTHMPVEMGRTAVVDVGPISLVLSEGAASMIDPELYRSQGIEPRDQKIVVVKSANGFRSEYAPFAAKILMVDTPGISSANLRGLPYRRVSRPIHPLDVVEFQPGK